VGAIIVGIIMLVVGGIALYVKLCLAPAGADIDAERQRRRDAELEGPAKQALLQIAMDRQKVASEEGNVAAERAIAELGMRGRLPSYLMADMPLEEMIDTIEETQAARASELRESLERAEVAGIIERS
jgi:hypothetical protein